jgi:hypothetical protein
MIDLAIGLVGLVLVVLAPFVALAQSRFSGRCLVLGAIIVGGWLGTVLYPEVRASRQVHQSCGQPAVLG